AIHSRPAQSARRTGAIRCRSSCLAIASSERMAALPVSAAAWRRRSSCSSTSSATPGSRSRPSALVRAAAQIAFDRFRLGAELGPLVLEARVVELVVRLVELLMQDVASLRGIQGYAFILDLHVARPDRSARGCVYRHLAHLWRGHAIRCAGSVGFR